MLCSQACRFVVGRFNGVVLFLHTVVSCCKLLEVHFWGTSSTSQSTIFSWTVSQNTRTSMHNIIWNSWKTTMLLAFWVTSLLDGLLWDHISKQLCVSVPPRYWRHKHTLHHLELYTHIHTKIIKFVYLYMILWKKIRLRRAPSRGAP